MGKGKVSVPWASPPPAGRSTRTQGTLKEASSPAYRAERERPGLGRASEAHPEGRPAGRPGGDGQTVRGPQPQEDGRSGSLPALLERRGTTAARRRRGGCRRSILLPTVCSGRRVLGSSTPQGYHFKFKRISQMSKS